MIESPEGKETVLDGVKVVAALQQCESNAATLTTDHVQLEQRVRQLEELVRSLRQDFNVCTREKKEKTCARDKKAGTLCAKDGRSANRPN